MRLPTDDAPPAVVGKKTISRSLKLEELNRTFRGFVQKYPLYSDRPYMIGDIICLLYFDVAVSSCHTPHAGRSVSRFFSANPCMYAFTIHSGISRFLNMEPPSRLAISLASLNIAFLSESEMAER